ncbi:MAG: ABC transporter substrate-binding protein [Thermoleophilia bacterium]|nr:ABC transporter substrate-binding protein [Thermoleophilia bacterium]
MRIRFGYSADADDAFMAWALPADWEHVVSDIQTLNEWALEGRLEVTALSAHAYALVRDRYELLPCGASMGLGYGPVVVAAEQLSRGQLQRTEIAVPGRLTTGFLVLREYLGGDFLHRVVPFDEILDEVASGRAAAGLVLHEGQLIYERQGLAKCVDVGEWWTAETGLPLPLGLVAARHDVDSAPAAAALRSSIESALAHREEALRFAAGYSRGVDEETIRRHVELYVNELTLDLGDEGRRAVDELLALVEGR